MSSPTMPHSPAMNLLLCHEELPTLPSTSSHSGTRYFKRDSVFFYHIGRHSSSSNESSFEKRCTNTDREKCSNQYLFPSIDNSYPQSDIDTAGTGTDTCIPHSSSFLADNHELPDFSTDHTFSAFSTPKPLKTPSRENWLSHESKKHSAPTFRQTTVVTPDPIQSFDHIFVDDNDDDSIGTFLHRDKTNDKALQVPSSHFISALHESESTNTSKISKLKQKLQIQSKSNGEYNTDKQSGKAIENSSAPSTPATPSEDQKDPDAPKRFKSSYICFFVAKRPEVKKELGSSATFAEIARKLASMWRDLHPDGPERKHWAEEARKDKIRYMLEKEMYNGPWKVPEKNAKRRKKDPTAPKRTMSAFLHFAKLNRKIVKKDNPGVNNADISKLLGQMWKEAEEETRRPHCLWEEKQRKQYKKEMAKWRAEQKQICDENRRKRDESISSLAAKYDAFDDTPSRLKVKLEDSKLEDDSSRIDSKYNDSFEDMTQNSVSCTDIDICLQSPSQDKPKGRNIIEDGDHIDRISPSSSICVDTNDMQPPADADVPMDLHCYYPLTPEIVLESKAMLMGNLPVPFIPFDDTSINDEEWPGESFAPLRFSDN